MEDAQLAALIADCTDLPYPGEWQQPPYPGRTVDGERYLLLAVDPGVGAIGLRPGDGSVRLLGRDGGGRLLNSGPDAMREFVRLYREAAVEAEAYQAPDPEDVDALMDASDAFTGALVARFAAVDPAAVAEEEAYWCIAAEELGYELG